MCASPNRPKLAGVSSYLLFGRVASFPKIGQLDRGYLKDEAASASVRTCQHEEATRGYTARPPAIGVGNSDRDRSFEEMAGEARVAPALWRYGEIDRAALPA
jgi:hypothetical protein